MNEYEMMYILHPRLNADEVTAAIERVNQQVVSQGGEVLSLDNWGRRRLAYPIRHHFEGTYVLSTFRMPPEGTTPLEQQLLISEEVIRHLLIRGIIPFEGRHTDDRAARGARPDEGRRDESREDERDEGETRPAATATAPEAGAAGEQSAAEAPASEARAEEEPETATSSAPTE